MRSLPLFLLSVALSVVAFVPLALAVPTISFVEGDCTGGLTCVFSIDSTENSHAGACGYFGTSVCVNFTSAVIRDDICQQGDVETTLLSLFQENDTHVGVFGISNYETQLCVAPTIGVSVRTTCNPNETCLISLNATNNSHVGDCDYYGNKLCLGPPDNNPPTITVQSPQNTTYFTVSQSVWANVTINEIASKVLRSVDGGSNETLGNSSGNWNGQLTDLSDGAHRVTFHANDTSNNFAEPQTVFFTVDTSPFVITVDLPQNTTYRGNEIRARVLTNREASSCSRSLNNGANTSMTETTATQWDETLTLDEGPYNIRFYCSDAAGNVNASSTIFFTVDYDTVLITGSSLYLGTGQTVTSGRVTATILQTGESNSTEITGPNWDIALTSPTAFRERRATIGIFVNESSGRSGYYTLTVGTGSLPLASTTCQSRTWRFSGTVVDPSVGSLSSSGTVRVDIDGTQYSNSTSYSNGLWDISVTPCLVPGEAFDANILLTDSSGKLSRIAVRQTAA